MADIRLHIEGGQAEATAAELEALLSEQFGRAPQREPAPVQSATPMKTDPVAILALVLALPGAIKETLELAERIELKQKFQHLIDFARRERRIRGTRVWLERKTRIEPLPLDEAKLSDLLDQ